MLSIRTDSYLDKEYLNPHENISGEQEFATVISPQQIVPKVIAFTKNGKVNQ